MLDLMAGGVAGLLRANQALNSTASMDSYSESEEARSMSKDSSEPLSTSRSSLLDKKYGQLKDGHTSYLHVVITSGLD
jgi:hypothetical protein